MCRWYGPLYALIGLLFLMYLFIIASAKLQVSEQWQAQREGVCRLNSVDCCFPTVQEVAGNV